ncbi:MAG TPA: hypothetical protein DEA63_01315, partial [Firmicutes bacterium]|nr:hypothetical protein [Bacillota bacterium]
MESFFNVPSWYLLSLDLEVTLRGSFSKKQIWMCLLSVFSWRPANQTTLSYLMLFSLKNLGNSDSMMSLASLQLLRRFFPNSS